MTIKRVNLHKALDAVFDALTSEQMERGRRLMKEWWEANYRPPTVYGIEAVHGKGREEKYRDKFRKDQKAEERRVYELLKQEYKRAKDAAQIQGLSAWKAAVLKKYPTARFKGPNAWVDRKNGGLKFVGQYDVDLEQGHVE